jgi:AAA domain
MKVTKLSIKGVGLITDTEILLNKPLLLFYGEIRQGKTTILNSVRWVCGGEFPSDIIQHGKDEALIELEFEGGMISRSWYRAKDGSTKSRPVVFVRNGKPVASPVAEIKRFLNPFLLDQDFLRNKNEIERKAFFIDLFGVNTVDLDKELFDKGREATALRAKLTGYGTIDLTPVEPVDIEAAQAELTRINTAFDSECGEIETANEAARTHNNSVDLAEANRTTVENEIVACRKKLKELEAQLKAFDIPDRKTLGSKPNKPDTSALEKQIQDAGAINERAAQFERNKKRADDKKADEDALSKLESRQRAIKKEKTTKLKEISTSCGIAGLEFDETGSFIYEGTTASMISDSQIMRLSSELSAMYPEGMGLQVLDRGESLGRSIFEYVDFAERKKVTVLATVVGQKPAETPEKVGVFVVRDGSVLPDVEKGKVTP